jgi:hypothetical protein
MKIPRKRPTGFIMTNYHATFCIRGEVVAMLTCQEPAPRLLIDISAQPADEQAVRGFVHRTSFCVTDATLIKALQDKVSVGDVIEATGSFWQSGYVPHRNSVIDTTFSLSAYQLIQKRVATPFNYSPYLGLCLSAALH